MSQYELNIRCVKWVRNFSKMPLSLLQKAEIYAKLDKGISGNFLAAEYNVAKSTISYLRKQRNNVKKAISIPYKTQKSIRLSKSQRSKLEDTLYNWTLEQQTNNIALSNKMLKDKAKHLYYNIYATDDFKPGDKWLRNFKLRHNIQLNSQFSSPDMETTSDMAIKSMGSLESASTISEVEEKSVESREKHDDNSGFKMRRNYQTIENPLHDYDDGTCGALSELSEGSLTNSNDRSTATLKEENGSCSNYVSSNGRSDEHAHEDILKNDSMSEFSWKKDSCALDESVDFQNRPDQLMSFEKHSSSDGSDQDTDNGRTETSSYASQNSTESFDVSDIDSGSDSTASSTSYSCVEDDPNILCRELRTLINASHETKKIISSLRNMGYIH